jgi:NADPH:quinone reductase-like Zn-dependent oxidoreductase
MKAVWYTRQGRPADVMQYGEQPTPHAGAGEVRVRLHASGVNPADANRCTGRSYAMEGPLVTGGAGAVGHYAVQWAKRFGAHVVTTASSAEKAAHALRAGADLIVNYRSEDVAARVREHTDGRGVHHIVDVDFGGNLAASLQVLAPNGSIAYYASAATSRRSCRQETSCAAIFRYTPSC